MSLDRSSAVVLLVDDDPLVLDVVQSSLEDAGFTVSPAATGEAAMTALENRRARDLDALVTDVNLGARMSGWRIATRARELKPGLPVVYVSGDSAHDWNAHGVPKSLFVQKPFVPAQIVTALARLLEDA